MPTPGIRELITAATPEARRLPAARAQEERGEADSDGSPDSV
jgi:hypothetical protein